MQYFVIAHRKPEFSQEDFAPHMPSEALFTLSLLSSGRFRSVHTRTDQRGAVIVIEAASRAEVDQLLASLPLAQKGMLTFDVHETAAYRGLNIVAEIARPHVA